MISNAETFYSVQSATKRCFADDTRLCKFILYCPDVSNLQSDLDNVIDWSSRNNMALHEDKFEYITHRENMSNTPQFAL